MKLVFMLALIFFSLFAHAESPDFRHASATERDTRLRLTRSLETETDKSDRLDLQFNAIFDLKGDCAEDTKRIFLELELYDDYMESIDERNPVKTSADHEADEIYNSNWAVKAKSHIKKIHSILASAENRNLQCFNSLATFYTIATANIVGPDDKRNWIYFFLFLAHEKKIHVLGKTERATLGGLWNTQSIKKQTPLMYGAYACESSTIFVDPYRAPIDLAAILYHELGHLLRDKLGGSNSPSSNMRETLLLDETLATIQGGLIQNAAQNTPEKKDPSSEIGFDFHLMNRKGRLQSLYSDWNMSGGTIGTDFTNLQHLFAYTRQSPERAQKLDEIFALVGRGYFQQSANLNSSVWRSLPDEPSSQLDPIKFFHFDGRVFPSESIWMRFKDLSSPAWQRAFEKEADVLDPQFLDRLLDFKKKLNTVSPLCRQFHQQLENGELNDYIGGKVPVPGKKRPGVQPGGEGVRPSIGLRPCLSIDEGF